VAIKAKKKFTEKFAMDNAKFNAEFESLEKKCKKVHTQNYRSKTFALSNYSQKTLFFVTFSLITFFA
jgi:hypothetical protein